MATLERNVDRSIVNNITNEYIQPLLPKEEDVLTKRSVNVELQPLCTSGSNINETDFFSRKELKPPKTADRSHCSSDVDPQLAESRHGENQQEHHVVQESQSDNSNSIGAVQSECNNKQASQSETPWSWVVMCASFFISVTVDGLHLSYGVFQLEFLDYFGSSKAHTSAVGSVQSGVYHLTGPLVSLLSDRYGFRKVAMIGSLLTTLSYMTSFFAPSLNVLIVTYGLIGGVGYSLMYLPSIAAVSYYFTKYRAFATGVAVCGTGLGTFTFALLTSLLVVTYTWQGAMMVIAGITLNGCVCGATYFPLTRSNITSKIPKEEEVSDNTASNKNPVANSVTNIDKVLSNAKDSREETDKPHLGLRLLKNPALWVYAIGVFAMFTGLLSVSTYLPDIGESIGLSRTDAIFLLSISGIASTVARILTGILTNQQWSNCIIINCIVMLILGGASVASPHCKSYALLVVYSCTVGATTGSLMTLRSIVSIELFGLNNMSMAFGMTEFWMGVASVISPPAMGALNDVTGKFDVAFYIQGTLIVIFGLASLPLRRLAKSKQGSTASVCPCLKQAR